MIRQSLAGLSVLLAAAVSSSGCQSPYYADQGALLGGLGGAGVGALVGNAVGNTGAGAVIGAGVGALTGAAVGSSLDEIEARNRAMIESQLGRQVRAGSVTIDDVLAMTAAGVDAELIATHIQAHGSARPLQTGDLIVLQQQGVDKRVIQTLQTVSAAPPVVMRQQAAPPPVIVEEHYYGYGHPPRYCGPSYYYPRYRPPPRVSWGLSYGHHH